jgi:hypothetical protein
VDVIRDGERLTVQTESAIQHRTGIRALIASGSTFRVHSEGIHLEEGSCYALLDAPPAEAGRDPGERTARLVSGDGFSFDLSENDEAYMRVPPPDGGGASTLGALLDLVSVPAWAAGPPEPGALVIVFRGETSVLCDGRRFELSGGEGLFADRLEEGQFGIAAFIDKTEAAAAEAARFSEEQAGGIARYRAVIACYERSLAAKRRRLAATGVEADERGEIEIRIAIVEAAKAAHEARLAGMVSPTSEGRAAELEDLARRVEVLREAEAGYVPAMDRLEGYDPGGE